MEALALRRTVLLMAIAMFGPLVFAAVACAGGKEGTSVTVRLSEWEAAPAAREIEPGKVRFEVSNSGTMPHELVVVKSDLPPEELEVVNGKVDESRVNVIDRTPSVAASGNAESTLELSPGKYVLLCNIVDQPAGAEAVSHFENGMYASFLVE
jgi:hypothetical protein